MNHENEPGVKHVTSQALEAAANIGPQGEHWMIEEFQWQH